MRHAGRQLATIATAVIVAITNAIVTVSVEDPAGNILSILEDPTRRAD